MASAANVRRDVPKVFDNREPSLSRSELLRVVCTGHNRRSALLCTATACTLVPARVPALVFGLTTARVLARGELLTTKGFDQKQPTVDRGECRYASPGPCPQRALVERTVGVHCPGRADGVH